MQNDMNKPHKKNQVIKALQWFGVVAVSLLLVLYFLVVDTRGGQKTPVIGKVNGIPMYYSRESAYGRAYERIVNTYKQFGITPDGNMAGFMSELAFKEAATAMLLEQAAEKNISVSDNFVVEMLKNEFVDTNGIFLEDQYKAFLTRTATSEKIKIEKDIKNSLLQSLLSFELFASAKTSNLELKNKYLKEQTKRDIEMLYVAISDIIDSSVIEPNELNKYFSDNKTNFAQAEVSIMAVSSKSSADNIYNDLSKKVASDTNAFAKIAIEKNEVPIGDKDGYLGFYTKQEFPSAEIGEAVFKAGKANTLLKPIFFDEKYFIILVRSMRVPEKIEDVKESIVSSDYIKNNRTVMYDKIKTEKTSELENLVSQAANVSLSSIANKAGFKYYKSSSPFSFASKSVSDMENKSIPDSSSLAFHNAVFTSDVGSLSKVIALSDGIAVIRVLSEIKPSEKDYNDYVATTGIKSIRGKELTTTERNLRTSWSEAEYSKSRIIKNKGF